MSVAEFRPRFESNVESHSPIIGQTPAICAVRRLIETLAPHEGAVLVTGPTGAGKELVAEELHRLSGRSGRFVAVNCAAIPTELLEGELFGHEKGAFTGADRQRIGLIEQADGGTLFLDEIGDMPMALQAKLLRVLERCRVTRLGGNEERAVDFRLVTATHRNLAECVDKGTFRSDLYFRISVFPVVLPGLASRAEDIPLILGQMMVQYVAQHPGTPMPQFDTSALRMLASQPWPGNVRELRTIMLRAIALFPDKRISARQVRDNLLTLCLPDPEQPILRLVSDEQATPVEGAAEASGFALALAQQRSLDMRSYLRDIEVALIEAALDRSEDCVAKAADILRLNRTTLIEKMKKYGLRRA